MVILKSRVWINWVRLPVFLEVSRIEKMNIPLSPYAPENLVSREGFSRPAPRQPAHSPYSFYNLVFTHGIPPHFHGGAHLFILTVIFHLVSPEFIGSRNCVPMAFTAESPPAKGQCSLR